MPSISMTTGASYYGGIYPSNRAAASRQSAQNSQGSKNSDTAVNEALKNGENPAADSDAAVGKTVEEDTSSGECKTCENRKYQDGSDDPGVSFKTAAKISPDASASVVRAHEQEHVTREQAKAQREDREVVSQSVMLHTAVCSECGKPYVSGGTTRTVTRAKQSYQQQMELGSQAKTEQKNFSAAV